MNQKSRKRESCAKIIEENSSKDFILVEVLLTIIDKDLIVVQFVKTWHWPKNW